MRKQDQILQLIGSLSPAEKRYFRRFSSVQAGEKQYVELFDALEKATKYDAKALAAQLKVSPAQLADNKLYLNQLLLKSLRNVDDEPWKQPQHYKPGLDAINLIEHGLIEQAPGIIEKALEDARYFKKFHSVIALLALKNQCLTVLWRVDELKELALEISAASAMQEEWVSLHIICMQYMQLEAERKNKDKMEALLQHPLLQKNPDELLSIKAGSAWFNIYQRAYIFFEDNEKWLKVSQRMVSYYQVHPRWLDIHPGGYILGQISLVQVEYLRHNYAGAAQLLDLLQPFLHKPPKYLAPGRMESLRIEIQFYIQHTRAHVALAADKYEESVQLGRELYRIKDKVKLDERYFLVHEYAVALLHTGRTKEAYDKLEELVQMGDDTMADLHVYLRPLIILAQLDMEHYPVVPYHIKSSKAWMKRNKIKNADLEVFFHHAYVIAKAPTTERRQAWQNLLKAVENGEVNGFNENVHSLKTWLIAKIGRHKNQVIERVG